MHRRNRTKTTKGKNHFFVFFIFFITISPVSTGAPQRPQALAQSSCIVIGTGTLVPAPLHHSDCKLGLQTMLIEPALSTSTGHLGSILTKKRRGKSALSIVVTPVLDASAIAQLIAGMKGCTARWHNTPQASIWAWEDIMSASPVLSTRIYNVYQGSANITLPVIHPLLKYGSQNQFTHCRYLWVSC